MFEKIDEIFKNIEDIRDDINILLNIAKISLIDYIMIKRGSQDMPEHLSFDLLSQIDVEVEKLKAQIDALNKLKTRVAYFLKLRFLSAFLNLTKFAHYHKNSKTHK